MKRWIKTLVITTLFVLMVTSAGAHHKNHPPKEYHSYVTIYTDSERMCAIVYCQTEKEAQAVLQKVEDCIAGKIKTAVRFRDAVIKPSTIASARMFRNSKPAGK